MNEQSKTLKIRSLKNGDTVELRELSADWAPWTHQVNNFVHDPKRAALYSPELAAAGKKCCNSSSDYESLEKAEAAYMRAA